MDKYFAALKGIHQFTALSNPVGFSGIEPHRDMDMAHTEAGDHTAFRLDRVLLIRHCQIYDNFVSVSRDVRELL
ncbi:MAG: hypothetical protein OEQ39_18010 [Gammaproteobacteria bacterium]|nr:hypothetical protein [Gammaproteobacteria bacterium]